MEKEVIVDGRMKKVICIQITAARLIQPGETITIYYTDPDQSVTERQECLLRLFYFTCNCNRCVRELLEEVNITNLN